MPASQQRGQRAQARTVAVEMEGKDHGLEGFVDDGLQGPLKFEA